MRSLSLPTFQLSAPCPPNPWAGQQTCLKRECGPACSTTPAKSPPGTCGIQPGNMRSEQSEQLRCGCE